MWTVCIKEWMLSYESLRVHKYYTKLLHLKTAKTIMHSMTTAEWPLQNFKTLLHTHTDSSNSLNKCTNQCKVLIILACGGRVRQETTRTSWKGVVELSVCSSSLSTCWKTAASQAYSNYVTAILVSCELNFHQHSDSVQHKTKGVGAKKTHTPTPNAYSKRQE